MLQKTITLLIYSIFVQHVKHRTQITQECCRDYDVTTNSVKFVQQTTSQLSDGESSACN